MFLVSFLVAFAFVVSPLLWLGFSIASKVREGVRGKNGENSRREGTEKEELPVTWFLLV